MREDVRGARGLDPRAGGTPSAWLHAMIVAAVVLFAAFLMLGCTAPIYASCPHGDEPLEANIGHKVSEPDWSTDGERIVSCGTKIYFHAMTSPPLPQQPEPISDMTDMDVDQDNCVMVGDTARYNWDWNWQSTEGVGKTGTVEGLQVDKTYNSPGDRVVRLYVYDSHTAAGSTDDENKADSVTVRVKLTLETDSMEGSQWCTAGSHAIVHGGLAEAWQQANYTLAIDADHDTDCDHYTYLADELPTQAQVEAYLDACENQGCHLYLLGGHRYKANDDWLGASYQARLAVVFMFCAGGLATSEKVAGELHENACHDSDVGAIGHCTFSSTCPNYFEIGASTNTNFCSSCIATLKNAQNLDN